MKRPEPGPRPMRPHELEDPLNRWLYHPLAWQLAKVWARTPLSPNQVSVLGAFTVIAAGVFYVSPLWGGPSGTVSAIVGMALHMGWHVIDGSDGDLARMTGRSSPVGELVDGLCDYLSHVVLYLLLAVLLMQTMGGWAWAVVLPAGIAHAVQSNHVEAQRRFYQHWIYGKPWLANARPETGGPAGALLSLYLRVAQGTTPDALAIDHAVTAARSDQAKLEQLRDLVRNEVQPLLLVEKWLGPNSRAVVLGLSMLMTASPVGYFVYGGVWMSGLLILSVILHNRAWRRLAQRISVNAD